MRFSSRNHRWPRCYPPCCIRRLGKKRGEPLTLRELCGESFCYLLWTLVELVKERRSPAIYDELNRLSIKLGRLAAGYRIHTEREVGLKLSWKRRIASEWIKRAWSFCMSACGSARNDNNFVSSHALRSASGGGEPRGPGHRPVPRTNAAAWKCQICFLITRALSWQEKKQFLCFGFCLRFLTGTRC